MSILNPPSVDLKDMLDSSSAGLALAFGTTLFIASLPDMPNNAVCLYDTGGMSQLQYKIERPNVQVRVRNVNYSTGYALIRDIKYYLHQVRNGETWSGATYIQIETRSDILYMGQDEKNRHSWTVNFSIYRSGN